MCKVKLKTEKIATYDNYYVCPICDYYGVCFESNYCSECGVKLDWDRFITPVVFKFENYYLNGKKMNNKIHFENIFDECCGVISVIVEGKSVYVEFKNEINI